MFLNVSPENAGIASENVLKFLKILEQYNFCTHSVIMARGDKIFAEAYYAPFDKDFKHRMYSISKSFVSVAIGLAEEEGLLSIDDKFIDYFPEYDKNAGENMKNMTIREMLTMETCISSGIDWFTAGAKDRCDVYFQSEINRIPGTTFLYDSSASFMLGVIVEKLTGKPFLEYLKEKILLKTGFSADAYCLKTPGGHSFGDSGVMCTARDLLTFARFVMNKGTWDGVRYMNENYLAEAIKKQVSNNNASAAQSYGGYGYGYQIWKTPHDGFAFIGMGDQFAICDPATDFIFVINSDNQGSSPVTRAILYHELYKTIVDNLGEPIEENPKALSELNAYIKDLKLYSLSENSDNEFYKKIDKATYVLDKNPMEIEYVRFDFEGKKGVLTYKNKQGEKKLVFGLGYNEFSKFPQYDYADMTATIPEKGHMYACASSADFPEEKKLRIKVQVIDKYFGNLSMIFGFKGDGVGIVMTKTAEAFLEEYQGYANGKRI